MADKINGYGRVGLDVAPTRPRAVHRTDGESGATAARRDSTATDAVEITGTAARLKAIEARLAGVPEVDAARVKAARERLESGDYKPDPARIAAKLLRMDRDFG
ncbi:MAG: flagellar biosynthesis anti-sigma factor FlgM [Gammaproteobacteria bacterium]|nr:flagellar biosynthesis anti-sigma factor FlgM [Gammaproteobacteria bacterium]QOJ31016.1 MAG: flagellar biosynthesis anti-sigma factor FlgM [Gammaproteobacteria bacterium]